MEDSIKDRKGMKKKRDTSFLKQNLIAHCGVHNLKKGIPENSLPAFDLAKKKCIALNLTCIC